MTAAEATDTGRVAIEAVGRVLPGGQVAGEPWKLAGGAMHDSWAVDAEAHGVRRELVVRVSPAGRADHQKTLREYEVLKVAYARGVLCPEPIAVGECESGEDYLVMARVTGDTNPRQLITGERFGEARTHIIRQLAENLARIHEIQPQDVPHAPGIAGPEPGEEPLAFQRRAVEATYRLDLLDPHPALEWAFRWLDRQLTSLPTTGRAPCVVHGDFRIGNMLYDENGLTSVLDWEGTHIGDPEEELAWFCTRVWRFGNHQAEAGGIAPREEWIRAYEEASGRPVSRERVAAWEVLQNIRWC
ncbi:MAG TPA: phosphotransferase family protein, partial [Tepidiformaceae bacterium]|nr:phosphotransferase family protein [Tepidiformaceae bacterium]